MRGKTDTVYFNITEVSKPYASKIHRHNIADLATIFTLFLPDLWNAFKLGQVIN